MQRFRETNRPGTAASPKPLDAAWLRQLCLDCGADDAGLVEISRPALDNQRDDILRVFPATKTLLSFVCRMNRERVGNGLWPRSIQRFLSGLRLTFQPGRAAGLNALYHFTFTGKEPKEATVVIREGTLQIQDGHQGEADLRVTTDSETWLGLLANERSLLGALLRRKIRIKGSPKLLVAFGKCFPS